MKRTLLSIAAIVATTLAVPAYAATAIKITEVSPWSSGNSPLAADWFELTNTSTSAISITGWKMDDGSSAFSTSVALNGITSIGAGESVIFIESATSLSASFKSLWFGANAPASLQVGFYDGTGAGVGLSTSGDGVSIFNASGALQAKVTFGAADAAAPWQTFDNAVGADNAAISTLSVVGTKGAFTASGASEVGSPGRIAAAVPESETYAMMLAGLAVFGAFARKRQQ